jgi:hypothetical protein
MCLVATTRTRKDSQNVPSSASLTPSHTRQTLVFSPTSAIFKDELAPLVRERPSRDVASNSFANVLSERGNVIRKLHGNARNKQHSIANVSTTSGEEEACPETPSFKVSASHSVRNRRLSRAGQTTQPEDTLLILSVSPVVYLL